YVAICIGGGAALGLWIDDKLDLNPVFTLLGLGLGIALAIIGMFRMLMAVLSDTSNPGNDREA
ncbi:MAG: AtpZ/AtpI family protein, partial [Chloroflexi bacterium]|nr:AtpZ/AtpI family protein [Chloroflexota bacterium]